jgi:hypothetical protein
MATVNNPFLAMYDAWLDSWRGSTHRFADIAREVVREPRVREFTDSGVHKLLLEVECDELTATKFFLGVITMAEAAGVYHASIDSLPPELVPEAIEDLEFDRFEYTDEEVPDLEHLQAVE